MPPLLILLQVTLGKSQHTPIIPLHILLEKHALLDVYCFYALLMQNSPHFNERRFFLFYSIGDTSPINFRVPLEVEACHNL